jgi:hypothetical protein
MLLSGSEQGPKGDIITMLISLEMVTFFTVGLLRVRFMGIRNEGMVILYEDSDLLREILSLPFLIHGSNHRAVGSNHRAVGSNYWVGCAPVRPCLLKGSITCQLLPHMKRACNKLTLEKKHYQIS